MCGCHPFSVSFSNLDVDLLSYVLTKVFFLYIVFIGLFEFLRKNRYNQWRTQKFLMGRGFVQWRIVIICIWCALFVTSQFDVRFMFPNRRFG